MLQLQAAPSFRADVKLPLPNGDVANIACIFRWMPQREMVEFLRQVGLASYLDNRAFVAMQHVMRWLAKVPGLRAWASRRVLQYRSHFDYLDRIVVAWERVDLPWSREACDQLLLICPEAPIIIMGAWAEKVRECRRGN